MTKKEFLNEVGGILGEHIGGANAVRLTDVVLMAVRDVVANELRAGQTVTIPNLGIKLEMVQRKATPARKGRNPATGEIIVIPPKHRVVKARVLQPLKDLA